MTSKFNRILAFVVLVASVRSFFCGGAAERCDASGTVVRAVANSLCVFASKRFTARSCSASSSSEVYARCMYTAASMGGSTRLVNACSAPAPSRSWSFVHFLKPCFALAVCWSRRALQARFASPAQVISAFRKCSSCTVALPQASHEIPKLVPGSKTT